MRARFFFSFRRARADISRGKKLYLYTARWLLQYIIMYDTIILCCIILLYIANDIVLYMRPARAHMHLAAINRPTSCKSSRAHIPIPIPASYMYSTARARIDFLSILIIIIIIMRWYYYNSHALFNWTDSSATRIMGSNNNGNNDLYIDALDVSDTTRDWPLRKNATYASLIFSKFFSRKPDGETNKQIINSSDDPARGVQR